MKITLKNLPSNERINGIKAVKYALKPNNDERYGLREAKDLVDASIASSANPDRYDVTGEMQTTEYTYDRDFNLIAGKKLTADNIKGYILSNCFKGIKNIQIVFHDPIEKIETKGKQIFNVPNDKDGKIFMDALERYLNRPQYTFRRRGRGSRKEAGDQSYVPLNASEWVAVYINELNETQTENAILKNKVERLEKENRKFRIESASKQLRDEILIQKASKKANEYHLRKIHEDKNDLNVKSNDVKIRTITWIDTLMLPN